MPRELTPTEVGRMFAMQDMAADAQARADRAKPAQPNLAPEDVAYLAAYADTCRSVADRLRASPGAKP